MHEPRTCDAVIWRASRLPQGLHEGEGQLQATYRSPDMRITTSLGRAAERTVVRWTESSPSKLHPLCVGRVTAPALEGGISKGGARAQSLLGQPRPSIGLLDRIVMRALI